MGSISGTTMPDSAGSTSAAVVALPDLSKNGWVGRNSSKWTCQVQETKTAPATNLFLADKLEELGKLAAKATGMAIAEATAEYAAKVASGDEPPPLQ